MMLMLNQFVLCAECVHLRQPEPPEATLPNKEHNKLQREGLEKLIEVEKDRFDQQSMLRWTMGGTNDNRKSRAEAEERLTEAE